MLRSQRGYAPQPFMPPIAATPQPPWLCFEASVAVPGSRWRGCAEPRDRVLAHCRTSRGCGTARWRAPAPPRARDHPCLRFGAHGAPQARCDVLRGAAQPFACALALMAHAPRPRVPDQLALARVERGHRAARWRADMVLLDSVLTVWAPWESEMADRWVWGRAGAKGQQQPAQS
eukprot:gene4461-biopygen1037